MNRIATTNLTSAAWPENAAIKFQKDQRDYRDWASLEKRRRLFVFSILIQLISLLTYFNLSKEGLAYSALGVFLIFFTINAVIWRCRRCLSYLRSPHASFCPSCRVPLSFEALLKSRKYRVKQRRRPKVIEIKKTPRWVWYTLAVVVALMWIYGAIEGFVLSHHANIFGFTIMMLFLTALVAGPVYLVMKTIESYRLHRARFSERRCPSCRAYQPTDTSFCTQCGNSL